jgi:nucleoside phosphorylase
MTPSGGAGTSVTIGLVTALPIESAAMRLLIDNDVAYTAPGDRGRYRLGTVPSTSVEHPHQVALTVLPLDGTRNAAAVCADLLRSFPAVRAVVMVGIAGGVPAPATPQRHVRLGDVVSATEGVVDYDHVRSVNADSALRRSLDGPSMDLVRADREIETAEALGDPPWRRWLLASDRRIPDRFRRPSPDTDVLRSASGQPIPHPPLEASGHQEGWPKIHRGRIGSADRLLRAAVLRDNIAARYQICAVEMEASGVAVATALRGVPYLVVRGIADYADGSKNDLWHPYAAFAAAAYTRALLVECNPFPIGGSDHIETLAERRHDNFLAIVDSLRAIRQLRDPDELRSFIAALPDPVAVAVPYAARADLQLLQIVRTCMEMAGGQQMLIDALTATVPESSVPRERAVRMIRDAWPRPGSIE